jgi:hypothetical protein
MIAASSSGLTVVYLLIFLLEVAGLWVMFTKAQLHGWGAIIPFYNYWLYCRLCGRPGWWFILLLIPFVNIVIWAILAIACAKAFNKSGGFAVGIFFLPFVFFPILGFGSDQYSGTLG